MNTAPSDAPSNFSRTYDKAAGTDIKYIPVYLNLGVILERNTLRCVHRLLITANVIPSSPILAPLMMEMRSSETSVLTRATRRNIPEDVILHSHRYENLKSYIALTVWAL
jgi:hypothetical protein